MLSFRDYIEAAGRTVHFPGWEGKKIKKRLSQGKSVYLTKPANIPFEKGERVRTPWGHNLKIIDIGTFDDPDKHPMKFKLSDREMESLRNMGSFQILKMRA